MPSKRVLDYGAQLFAEAIGKALDESFEAPTAVAFMDRAEAHLGFEAADGEEAAAKGYAEWLLNQSAEARKTERETTNAR